jgi:hypothetical protein
MSGKPPISMLEEEDRRARTKLAAYRAQLLGGGASPMAAEMRLRELERRAQGAAERLRAARRAS